MAIDPVPAITESNAVGETAEIYADIRSSLGIGVVNLIWRHLAVFDGALPWVWQAVKPVYVSGAAACEAAALYEGLNLPKTGTMTPALFRLAGVADDDKATILAILDSYNRGNTINLVALSALHASPSRMTGTQPSAPLPTVNTPIPALPSLDQLEPDTRDLVLTLSELGAGPNHRIIPSMYRHLAYWPGFLTLIWSLISPMHADGRLNTLIRDVEQAGQDHAARIANQIDRGPEPTTATAALAAIDEFRRTAISRMVPIAMIVRHALD